MGDIHEYVLHVIAHGTHSDPNERAHFWLMGAEPGASTHELLDSPTEERMYIDTGEVLRVRVEIDEFYDDEPGPPKASEGVRVVVERRRPPYKITVCAGSVLAYGRTDAVLVQHTRTGSWTRGMVARGADCHGGRLNVASISMCTVPSIQRSFPKCPHHSALV